MKTKKQLPKYKFGGINTKDKQNVKNFFGNTGALAVNTVANTAGVNGNVKDYEGRSANEFNMVGNVTGEVGKAAAPIVASAFLGPQAGMLVSGAQNTLGAVTPQEEMTGYDSSGKKIYDDRYADSDKSAMIGQFAGMGVGLAGQFMGQAKGSNGDIPEAKYGGQMKYPMGGIKEGEPRYNFTTKDVDGNFNYYKKLVTPEGPRFYTGVSPDMSNAQKMANFKINSNPADSIPFKQIPLDIQSKFNTFAMGGMKFGNNSFSQSQNQRIVQGAFGPEIVYDAQKSPRNVTNSGFGSASIGGGGGMTSMFAMGGMNMKPNAEVEGNEMITSNTPPQVFNNGGVELASNNPYGTPTYKTNGASHENGGIPVNMAPGSIINGKTKNPLTGNKFTKDIDILAKQENKFTKRAEVGDKYANTNAKLILPILAQKKDYLNNLQNAIIANKAQAKALRSGQLPQPNTQAPQEFAMGGVKLPMYTNNKNELPQFKWGAVYDGTPDPNDNIDNLTSREQGEYQNWFNQGSQSEGFNADDYSIGNYRKIFNPISENQKTISNDGSSDPYNRRMERESRDAALLAGTDMNSKYPNWMNALGKGLTTAAQLAPNIYNAKRYNKPEIEKYDRMEANLLNPDKAIANKNYLFRQTKGMIPNVSGGNSGSVMANIAANRANTSTEIGNLIQQYDNANAGIKNTVGQYNNELSRAEVIANAQNRARNRSGKGEWIGDAAKSFAQMQLDSKKDAIDQEALQMYKEYYNNPEFRAAMKKITFGSKK